MTGAYRNAALILGGLAGAAGVGLSAYAAHAGGDNAKTAALILMVHAPALVALGAVPASRLITIATALLAIGLVLFAGDLTMREFLGTRLFPMAAPSGGMALIAGWLAVALAGLALRRR